MMKFNTMPILQAGLAALLLSAGAADAQETVG